MPGELAQLGLGDRGDLRDGSGNVYVRLEVDLFHGDAVECLRLDMLDIVDRSGQCAFGQSDNAVSQVHGRQALVLPDNAHHRDINVWENIDRRVQDREWPKD